MSDTTAAQLKADIAKLIEQEERLQLPRLDAEVAWTIGSQLREAALAAKAAVTIEIRIGADTVFFHAMRGATPAFADWARRKRQVSELLDKSSYRIGRQLALENSTIEIDMGLPTRDYATHGGAVPLRVNGTRFGTATVSGLPQRDDHRMVIEVLAPLANVPLAEIALD